MWKDEYKTALVAGMNNENGFEHAKRIKNRNIPQRLYKYQSCEDYSLASLEKDELWIATASNFNDIHEGALFFDWASMLRNGDTHGFQNDDSAVALAIQHFLDQLRNDPRNTFAYLDELFLNLAKLPRAPITTINSVKAIMNTWRTESQTAPLRSSLNAISAILRVVNQHSPQNTQSEIKACSLSERVDSVLMWAHYANAYQGFCVEYDTRMLSNYRENLFPIIYTDKPLIMAKPNLKPHLKNSPFLATLAATYKAADWSYEKEWRILLINDWNNPDCGFRPAEKNGHLLNNAIPSAIYLGSRIDSQAEQKLVNIAKSKDILAFKMNLKPFSFQLEAIPLLP